MLFFLSWIILASLMTLLVSGCGPLEDSLVHEPLRMLPSLMEPFRSKEMASTAVFPSVSPLFLAGQRT